MSEGNLQHAVETALARARAVAEKDDSLSGILVGVSGGEGLVVLLHALKAIAGKNFGSVSVAHLDHGLRPDSERDAEFVRELAGSYGLTFITERAGTWDKKENLEAWARGVRYSFLERARGELRAEFIVTAHHQRDQAETILMRFMNGRLATDARGITEFSKEERLLRPLLGVSKADLRRYSSSYALQFCHDPSNDDLDRTRNLIRHKLIPVLTAELNPNLEATLGLVAARLTDDDEHLDADAEHHYRQNREFQTPSRIQLQKLEQAPRSLRWRILRLLALDHVGPCGGEIGYRALRLVSLRIESGFVEPILLEVGRNIGCYLSRSKGVRFEQLTASTGHPDATKVADPTENRCVGV